MLKFRLNWIVLVIGMLQVCTATPTDGIESDASKLFTPDEIERAKNADIPDQELIQGRSFGLTVEEMIKLRPIKSTPNFKKNNLTFDFVGTVCSKMVPEHTTATNYTKSQAMHLNESIYLVVKKLPYADHADIFRTTICPYVSQPDLYEMEAARFGLQFLLYLKIHFLKIKAQKASTMERSKVVKEMCCTYDGKDYSDPGITRDLLNFDDLPENELSKFSENWNEFETENTSESLKKICDFVEAKNPYDECGKGVVSYDY